MFNRVEVGFTAFHFTFRRGDTPEQTSGFLGHLRIIGRGVFRTIILSTLLGLGYKRDNSAYPPNNMAKYLRDISVWMPPSDEATKWALSTNFLIRLYLDSLPKLKSEPIAKVIVTPCISPPETRLVLMNNPDVIQLLKPFDFDQYWKADKESRKHVALDFLQEGLLEIATVKSWDVKPLNDAYATVLEKKLVNDRPWIKAIGSPDRRTKAQVWCHYDSDKADIYVSITTRKGNVSKADVASVKPGDVWINDAVGKLEWSSNNKIRLVSRDRTQSWSIAVPH